jgi:uncharacterized protein YeaO (DUF488 family)
VAIAIIRLGTERHDGEGLRLGTVRRPPRGVPKREYATRNYYDVWLPTLAPSQALLQEWKVMQDERQWKAFTRKFRAEMRQPHAAKLLDLLAALSHQTNLAIGCYCKDESRCHRSLLRELLAARGASLA